LNDRGRFAVLAMLWELTPAMGLYERRPDHLGHYPQDEHEVYRLCRTARGKQPAFYCCSF